MKRLIPLTLVVALAGFSYFQAGWIRLQAFCDVGPGPHVSWNWKPVGFKCAYADGTSETSLWPADSHGGRLTGGRSSTSTTSFSNGLRLVKSKDFTWLTMAEPENVTLEYNRFRGTLSALTTGCVVLRLKAGYTVPMWPNGTTVDRAGTIRSSIGTFRLGQKVDGSATEWRRSQLKPAKSVKHMCPIDKTNRYHPRLRMFDFDQYARVDDGLKVIEN